MPKRLFTGVTILSLVLVALATGLRGAGLLGRAPPGPRDLEYYCCNETYRLPYCSLVSGDKVSDYCTDGGTPKASGKGACETSCALKVPAVCCDVDADGKPRATVVSNHKDCPVGLKTYADISNDNEFWKDAATVDAFSDYYHGRRALDNAFARVYCSKKATGACCVRNVGDGKLVTSRVAADPFDCTDPDANKEAKYFPITSVHGGVQLDADVDGSVSPDEAKAFCEAEEFGACCISLKPEKTMKAKAVGSPDSCVVDKDDPNMITAVYHPGSELIGVVRVDADGDGDVTEEEAQDACFTSDGFCCNFLEPEKSEERKREACPFVYNESEYFEPGSEYFNAADTSRNLEISKEEATAYCADQVGFCCDGRWDIDKQAVRKNTCFNSEKHFVKKDAAHATYAQACSDFVYVCAIITEQLPYNKNTPEFRALTDEQKASAKNVVVDGKGLSWEQACTPEELGFCCNNTSNMSAMKRNECFPGDLEKQRRYFEPKYNDKGTFVKRCTDFLYVCPRAEEDTFNKFDSQLSNEEKELGRSMIMNDKARTKAEACAANEGYCCTNRHDSKRLTEDMCPAGYFVKEDARTANRYDEACKDYYYACDTDDQLPTKTPPNMSFAATIHFGTGVGDKGSSCRFDGFCCDGSAPYELVPFQSCLTPESRKQYFVRYDFFTDFVPITASTYEEACSPYSYVCSDTSITTTVKTANLTGAQRDGAQPLVKDGAGRSRVAACNLPVGFCCGGSTADLMAESECPFAAADFVEKTPENDTFGKACKNFFYACAKFGYDTPGSASYWQGNKNLTEEEKKSLAPLVGPGGERRTKAEACREMGFCCSGLPTTLNRQLNRETCTSGDGYFFLKTDSLDTFAKACADFVYVCKEPSTVSVPSAVVNMFPEDVRDIVVSMIKGGVGVLKGEACPASTERGLCCPRSGDPKLAMRSACDGAFFGQSSDQYGRTVSGGVIDSVVAAEVCRTSTEEKGLCCSADSKNVRLNVTRNNCVEPERFIPHSAPGVGEDVNRERALQICAGETGEEKGVCCMEDPKRAIRNSLKNQCNGRFVPDAMADKDGGGVSQEEAEDACGMEKPELEASCCRRTANLGPLCQPTDQQGGCAEGYEVLNGVSIQQCPARCMNIPPNGGPNNGGPNNGGPDNGGPNNGGPNNGGPNNGGPNNGGPNNGGPNNGGPNNGGPNNGGQSSRPGGQQGKSSLPQAPMPRTPRSSQPPASSSSSEGPSSDSSSSASSSSSGSSRSSSSSSVPESSRPGQSSTPTQSTPTQSIPMTSRSSSSTSSDEGQSSSSSSGCPPNTNCMPVQQCEEMGGTCVQSCDEPGGVEVAPPPRPVPEKGFWDWLFGALLGQLSDESTSFVAQIIYGPNNQYVLPPEHFGPQLPNEEQGNIPEGQYGQYPYSSSSSSWQYPYTSSSSSSYGQQQLSSSSYPRSSLSSSDEQESFSSRYSKPRSSAPCCCQILSRSSIRKSSQESEPSSVSSRTFSQPTTSQPSFSQPTTSQPNFSQPTTSRPTSQPTSQPGGSQPTSQPTSQPGGSQPTSQPGGSQPTSQPTSQPGGSQPTSQPGSSAVSQPGGGGSVPASSQTSVAGSSISQPPVPGTSSQPPGGGGASSMRPSAPGSPLDCPVGLMPVLSLNAVGSGAYVYFIHAPSGTVRGNLKLPAENAPYHHALAYHRSVGLYLLRGIEGQRPNLYIVTSAGLTLVGTLNVPITVTAMDFAQNGILYALDESGNALYAIDVDDARATMLRRYAQKELDVNEGDLVVDRPESLVYLYGSGSLARIALSTYNVTETGSLLETGTPAPRYTGLALIDGTYYAVDRKNARLHSFRLPEARVTRVAANTDVYRYGDATECAVEYSSFSSSSSAASESSSFSPSGLPVGSVSSSSITSDSSSSRASSISSSKRLSSSSARSSSVISITRSSFSFAPPPMVSSRPLPAVLAQYYFTSARPAGYAPQCGNGLLDGGEECDDGNNLGNDGCRPNCAVEIPREPLIPGRPVCGNAVLERGEECDDGNAVSGDGCTSSCLLEGGYCGDGVVQRELGETCDGDRTLGDLPYSCGPDCRVASPFCGNDSLDPGEECDNGRANGDGPNVACRTNCSRLRCGDGIVDATEECDDGNRFGGDGCSRLCAREVPGQIPGMPFLPATIIDLSGPLPSTVAPPSPTHPPQGPTGPGALLAMAAGAAGGYTFIRRRRSRL